MLEAWANSLPVAVSKRGGLAALVTQDTTGLFFDPESEADEENSIASVIARLSLDRDLAKALGEAGNKEAVASYSWDSITARLETIYQRVYEHSIR